MASLPHQGPSTCLNRPNDIQFVNFQWLPEELLLYCPRFFFNFSSSTSYKWWEEGGANKWENNWYSFHKLFHTKPMFQNQQPTYKKNCLRRKKAFFFVFFSETKHTQSFHSFFFSEHGMVLQPISKPDQPTQNIFRIFFIVKNEKGTFKLFNVFFRASHAIKDPKKSHFPSVWLSPLRDDRGSKY